jgi:single-strand DNA-binding protein
VLWRNEKLAEYLKKGQQLCLQGRLQTRSYEKNGEKRYTTEVVVSDVVLCGGKGQSSRPPAPTDEPPGETGISDDDVPF